MQRAHPLRAGGVVTLNPGTADFDTKHVGTGKTVAYSGYRLGGADANKLALFYSGVPESGTTTADITRAALGITAVNQAKTYGSAEGIHVQTV